MKKRPPKLEPVEDVKERLRRHYAVHNGPGILIPEKLLETLIREIEDLRKRPVVSQ